QATELAASLAHETEEVKRWALTLKRNCEEHLEDVLFLAPWLTSGDSLERLKRSIRKELGELAERLDQLDQASTLREVSALDRTLGPQVEEALKGLAAEFGDLRKE